MIYQEETSFYAITSSKERLQKEGKCPPASPANLDFDIHYQLIIN